MLVTSSKPESKFPPVHTESGGGKGLWADIIQITTDLPRDIPYLVRGKNAGKFQHSTWVLLLCFLALVSDRRFGGFAVSHHVFVF